MNGVVPLTWSTNVFLCSPLIPAIILLVGHRSIKHNEMFQRAAHQQHVLYVCGVCVGLCVVELCKWCVIYSKCWITQLLRIISTIDKYA